VEDAGGTCRAGALFAHIGEGFAAAALALALPPPPSPRGAMTAIPSWYLSISITLIVLSGIVRFVSTECFNTALTSSSLMYTPSFGVEQTRLEDTTQGP